MALHASIIDKLWNSEYGDRLDLSDPRNQNPTNVRTIDGEVVEIQINQHITEGLYRLEEYIPSVKPPANALPTYRFISPIHLGFVLQRLSTFIERGKTKSTLRSIKVDPEKLTRKQKQVIEEIFNQQVFDGSWVVSLNASRSEVEHVTVDIKDFDKCFSPMAEKDLLDDKDEWSDEEKTLTNVYLLLNSNNHGFVAFNLSELYAAHVIELEDVRELVDNIIEDRLAQNDYSRYNYSRAVASVARIERAQVKDEAASKMRHTNLVNHVATVLSEHNPKFRVTGHGEDYINYHVVEETGEFPYLAQYIQPLWRLTVPGLTGVVGNSMDKDEAFRMLESGFYLESKIKPLSEDDIHRLRHYRFPKEGNVEHGRFTYAVKRDKR